MGVKAQNPDTIDYYNMSLEELLNVEVEIVSKSALQIRETPGVITVISRKDIEQSGARDLMEILKLLAPGFEFGVDVEGVVGLGMRGIWTHEGKVLLLIDGMECNEELFSNTVFGNHYLPENIEKIEIIRGPGSALYGGYASVGVINIITKKDEMHGGYAGILYSQMQKTYSHRNVNFGYGNQAGDFKYSFTGAYAQGNRSELDNIDYYRDTVSMKGNSGIESYNMNLALAFKGLQMNVQSDLYEFQQIDLWGYNRTLGKVNETFNTVNARLKYDQKIGNKFKITPFVQYKFQQPWQLKTPEESYANSKETEKWFGGLNSIWDITEKMQLMTGVEYVNTMLSLGKSPEDYEELFKGDSKTKDYSTTAAYFQYIFLNKILNITLGSRYEYSSEYGESFVPRFGVTKAFENLHFKAMVSQSFRTPGGILPDRVPDGEPALVPEKASNYEFEAGVKIGKSYLTLSAFDIVFNKIIVYNKEEETGIGIYRNSGNSNTAGFDIDYKLKLEKIGFNFNYSYYTSVDHDIEIYKVPTHDDYYLGFAKHKFNGLFSLNLTEKLSVSATGSYLGKRFAYTYFDEATKTDILEEIEPVFVAGFHLLYKSVVKNLDISVGVHNLTNQKQYFLQPYSGEHAPLPGLSRSYSIRLNYNF